MTEESIIQAVQKHIRRRGVPPTRLTGDASWCFGGPETWLNIDNALRFGLRGLDGGSSLFRFLVEKGFREPLPDSSPVSEPEIAQALREFAGDHRGRLPFQIGLQAPVEPYLDLPGVTWATIDGRLRHGRCGLTGGKSLRVLAVEAGLCHERGKCPPLEDVRRAGKKYAEEHGRFPPRSGDATPYFGQQESWNRVRSLLGREYNMTLAEALQGLGIPRPKIRRSRILLSEEQIEAAVHSFKEETGKLPVYYSGEAATHFKAEDGSLTWNMVNRALQKGTRGLEGGNTLASFLVQKGFRPRKSGGPNSAGKSG